MEKRKASVMTSPKMKRDLTLTRSIDASPEIVFKAWTDPQQLAKWWGPQHFTNPVCEVDLRVGGTMYIVMRGPDGNDHPMKGVYREIIPAQKLAFTNIAVDLKGNHLLEGFTTVTFAEENGKTRLTVVTGAVGLVPIAEQMLEGMEAGWGQTLDCLEEFLAKKQGEAT
jgi:uncharacterized protein YndB with AHSA1/START domain